MKKTARCLRCEKEFICNAWDSGDYCSYSCKKNPMVTSKCNNCDKEFSYTKKSGNDPRKFCSKKCSSPSRTASDEDKFKNLKKRILDRTRNDEESGCLLWTGYFYKNGYGRISFNGQHHLVHRLAYFLYTEGQPIPNNLLVMHTCNTRACLRPAHLKLGSQKENLAQMIKEGRRSNKNSAKINEIQVKEIKRLLKEGKSHSSIAREYGVSAACITNINRGKSWKNITLD